MRAAAVLLGQVDPMKTRFASLRSHNQWTALCDVRTGGASPGSSKGRSWRQSNTATDFRREATAAYVSMKLVICGLLLQVSTREVGADLDLMAGTDVSSARHRRWAARVPGSAPHLSSASRKISGCPAG